MQIVNADHAGMRDVPGDEEFPRQQAERRRIARILRQKPFDGHKRSAVAVFETEQITGREYLAQAACPQRIFRRKTDRALLLQRPADGRTAFESVPFWGRILAAGPL